MRPPLYRPRAERLTDQDFEHVLAMMTEAERDLIQHQVRVLASSTPQLGSTGARELLLSIAAFQAALRASGIISD